MQNNILCALITPFGSDGRLDQKLLEKHVQWQLESGIAGFFLHGPIGEGASLNEKDWQSVLEIVASQAKNKTILVEITSPVKEVLARRIKLSEEIGITGVTALLPMWFGYSAAVAANYFRHLAEKTSLPVYLHNMPRITGFSVDEAMLQSIVAETNGRLAGILECSADWQLYKTFRDILPNGTIYYGRVEGMERAAAEGAIGVIAATANLCPEAHSILSKLQAIDKKAEAGQLADMLQELAKSIHVGQPVAAAIKAVLNKLERCTHWTGFPVAPLTGPKWEKWVCGVVQQVVEIEGFCHKIQND
jgi:dihydrodipicolinate synthase/N-acetylneuraminate lyase